LNPSEESLASHELFLDLPNLKKCRGTGFALMLVGIILPTHNQFGRIFHWWLIGIMIIVGEGSFKLPLVPVAAALAGIACDFACGRFIKPPESRFQKHLDSRYGRVRDIHEDVIFDTNAN